MADARIIISEETTQVRYSGVRELVFGDGLTTSEKGGKIHIAGSSASGDKLSRDYNAGGTIGGHRAVKLVAGVLQYADFQDIFTSEIVIGISENAASVGNPVTVVLSGTMEEPSWSWTPGLPIYLGATGVLTQTANTTFSSTELGIALTSTSILVRIQETIFF